MVLNQHCWLFTLHVPFEVKLRTQTMFSLFVTVKPFQMLNWSFLGVGTHVSQPCVPTPHHHHQRHVSQPRWWPTSYGLNELSIGPKLFLKYLRNKKALKTLKKAILGVGTHVSQPRWYDIILMMILMMRRVMMVVITMYYHHIESVFTVSHLHTMHWLWWAQDKG